MQRIDAIDSLIRDRKRVYLNISFKKPQTPVCVSSIHKRAAFGRNKDVNKPRKNLIKLPERFTLLRITVLLSRSILLVAALSWKIPASCAGVV